MTGSGLAASWFGVQVAGESRRSFRLSYEKGRGAFSRGDFHEALEEFLRASTLAGDDRDRLWALGNVVFCMENLGLPYARTLEEVMRLLESQPGGDSIERVRAQLHAFRLRAHFRAGHLGELFAEDSARGTSLPLDQGRYFAYWARLLPYHRFHRPLVPAELEAFSSPSALQSPFYKLRTLRGMLHPEDLKVIRPSEWIERLYLWVWCWLGAPSSFPVHRALCLLEGTDWQTILHRCTVEDSQLLRNALLWLGLFDPAAEALLGELAASLEGRRAELEYPLLELEGYVAQYLLARRRGDSGAMRELRNVLQRHPLWRSGELSFSELLDALEGRLEPCSTIEPLVGCLRALMPSSVSGTAAGLVVDLVHHQLVDRKRGLQIFSEPMVRALALLRSGEPVSCERFVQACFGLSEFDPLIHTGKIFNLLSRLKKATGGSPSFHLKSGAVLARGEWSSIAFRESRERVDLVPVLCGWKRGRAPATRVSRRPAFSGRRRAPFGAERLRDWEWRYGLSRTEIERRLELPRSTTNRWIAKWVDEGILRARGKARATRYYLVK